MKYIKTYKLFEYLNTSDPEFDKIVDVLSSECSEFLELLEKWNIKGVYRGKSRAYLSDPIVDGFWEKKSRTDRKPRDISSEIDNKLNDEFIKKFGISIRKSGVFATKDISTSREYGNHPFMYGVQDVYLFIPKNGFRYFWNPEVNDFFTDLKDVKTWYKKDPLSWNTSEKIDFQKVIDGYQEGGIEKANFHELIFICDGYYLLDLKYYDKFLDYFIN
jgi:hypothetical protein